jgi:hypothetical protein
MVRLFLLVIASAKLGLRKPFRMFVGGQQMKFFVHEYDLGLRNRVEMRV